MSDMFPGASALGDSVNALFSSKQEQTTAAYQQLMKDNQQLKSDRVSTAYQNQGTDSMLGIRSGATANSPSYGNDKNRPAVTADPQEVEARWMSRLAKFAGIAQSTGAKLGA